MPDHADSALDVGAGVFLTDDAALARCSKIVVEILSPPAVL